MDGHQAGTWRKRIEEQEGSGQSVVRYCAGQGVSRSSFYRWRKILAREDHPRARFLPVCVVQGKGEPFASAGVEIDGADLMLLLDGIDMKEVRRRPRFSAPRAAEAT